MVTVFLSPDQITPDPRNPRVHPPEQIEALTKSLKLFGQTYPVIARRANKRIIAGHGIHAAALQAGLDKIEVRLWDVDEDTAPWHMDH